MFFLGGATCLNWNLSLKVRFDGGATGLFRQEVDLLSPLKLRWDYSTSPLCGYFCYRLKDNFFVGRSQGGKPGACWLREFLHQLISVSVSSRRKGRPSTWPHSSPLTSGAAPPWAPLLTLPPTMAAFSPALLFTLPLSAGSSVLMLSLAPLCRWHISQLLQPWPWPVPQTAFPTADRTSPLMPCSPQPLCTQSAPLHLLTPFKMCRCLTVRSFQSGLLPGFQECLAKNFGVSYQKSTECLLCIRQHVQAWGREMHESQREWGWD